MTNPFRFRRLLHPLKAHRGRLNALVRRAAPVVRTSLAQDAHLLVARLTNSPQVALKLPVVLPHRLPAIPPVLEVRVSNHGACCSPSLSVTGPLNLLDNATFLNILWLCGSVALWLCGSQKKSRM